MCSGRIHFFRRAFSLHLRRNIITGEKERRSNIERTPAERCIETVGEKKKEKHGNSFINYLTTNQESSWG
jgi:hypothetical protein